MLTLARQTTKEEGLAVTRALKLGSSHEASYSPTTKSTVYSDFWVTTDSEDGPGAVCQSSESKGSA